MKGLLHNLEPYTDLKEPFPQFGFIIRKKYLKKELLYYKIVK